MAGCDVTGRRIVAKSLLVGIAALGASPVVPQAIAPPGTLSRPVVFDQPSPLGTNEMLLQRLLSPRQRQQTIVRMTAKGQALALYPIKLAEERFVVYVPKQRPTTGYGLLVFIPPWEDARLPSGWAGVLDHAGMIFVSADRSGNDQVVSARRVPLALTAVAALGRAYEIDPERTFAAGFSGGSRVAFRMAVAYPDIFAGALLNAGSDPIGTRDVPLPSAALLSLLQSRTRFVFVTGANDDINLSKDADARSALKNWCIDPGRAIQPPHLGHDVMDAASLSQALRGLDRPDKVDPERSSQCRTIVNAKIESARREAAARGAQPPNPKIAAALDQLERKFGSLLEQ